MKDLINQISSQNLRTIKENQQSFSQLLNTIVGQNLTNDLIIDLIGQQSYKTFRNELERIIKLQGVELVGEVKTVQEREKKESDNKQANLVQVSGITPGTIEQSENEQRGSGYVQTPQSAGTVEPERQYFRDVQRNAEIQPINEHLGAGEQNEVNGGELRNEPNNLATNAETDLGGVSSETATSNSDAPTDIQSNSRTMEGIINKRAEIESKIYGTREKKEALQILRENYDYPFKCPKGQMNSLAKYFITQFEGSLSTWCSFIRSVQQTDAITNVFTINN
jgi:hypothetical protein